MKKAYTIEITGMVQGVGFRPFVWRTAHACAITGSVQNNPGGVVIYAEGSEESLAHFSRTLSSSCPPLAKITSFTQKETTPVGATDFIIIRSTSAGAYTVQVSPDITVCDDCRAELFDPADRRYRYPFINCTNCGPRFTIIRDLPYDRAATSMAQFPLCRACADEYHDPSNRRYHAQPVACPDCGPAVFAHTSRGALIEEPWEELWRSNINAGKIVAVKGIGGFHLACNARDASATRLLRQRKKRARIPFALMTGNLDWVIQVCFVSVHEERLLLSLERPVVILKIKNRFPGIEHIAPGLDTIGIMLPYSPMHLLMLDVIDMPVVMTSANYSSEPMIHTNDDALATLGGVADLFLVHNRDIVNRCDDSVAACPATLTLLIRPGRGFAPYGMSVDSTKQVVAFGADMKNTFAFSHNGRLTASHYIGDCEHPSTQKILLENIEQSIRFYRLRPDYCAHDLHPDYFTTQLAREFARTRGLPTVAVQHHHAHCAAAYVQNNLSGKAIGFAFDGTGYGDDTTVWGGEVLLFDLAEYSREIHFTPVPLPGGDAAVTSPQRMLIAFLHALGLWEAWSDPAKHAPLAGRILEMMNARINCPLTSSVGRLFDAVACLCGFTGDQTYDGEAAMWLEACAAADEERSLPFTLAGNRIDCTGLFAALLDLKKAGISPAALAGRFHTALADIIEACGLALTQKYGSLPWVFSGGVFQNQLLIKKIASRETLRGFRIYFSSCPNDSGIAAGQVAVALAKTARF